MDSSDAGASRSPRIPELDGVRGLAIGMVFTFHYLSIARVDSTATVLLSTVIRSLWCGVDLFFVLSGFLITGILLDTKTRPDYLLRFFLRRTLRIFPLYYLVLTVVFILLPVLCPSPTAGDHNLEIHQAWLWTYTSNFKTAVSGFWPFLGDRVWLHHFWSLAVEEHFYLVWPFLVLAVTPKRLIQVCTAIMVAAPTLRVAVLMADFGPLSAQMLTPCRIDALAAGALLATALRSNDERLIRQVAILSGVAAVATTMLVIIRGGLSGDDAWVVTLGFTLLACTATGLILAAVKLNRSHLLRRGLRSGFLGMLGRYSYGLYVYHVVLQPTMNRLASTQAVQDMLHLPYTAAGIVRFTGAFVICLICAAASWHLLERRLVDYAHRRT